MTQPRKADEKRKQPEAPQSEHKRRTIEQVIVDLCAADPSGRSIDPTLAARTYAAERGETETLVWRKWLQQVRSTAIGMARKGELVIYRKGKPADPDDFRGVYRLGLPREE